MPAPGLSCPRNAPRPANAGPSVHRSAARPAAGPPPWQKRFASCPARTPGSPRTSAAAQSDRNRPGAAASACRRAARRTVPFPPASPAERRQPATEPGSSPSPSAARGCEWADTPNAGAPLPTTAPAPPPRQSETRPREGRGGLPGERASTASQEVSLYRSQPPAPPSRPRSRRVRLTLSVT